MSDENNNENEAPETPAPQLTNEAKDFIIKTVNAAVGGRTGRLEKKVEEMFAGLSETLAARTEPAEVGEVKESANDIQVKQLQARLDEEIRLRKEHESAVVEKETRGYIRETLEKKGVTGARAKAAMAMLYTEDKTIRRGEDGNVYFYARERGVTEPIPLDLESGIDRFLSTDEGKMFLPAREVGGSGTTGGRAPGAPSNEPSDADLLRQLGEFMASGTGE